MDTNTISCACLHDLCLSKVPLFASIGHERLRKITTHMQHRSYRKGETIIREGDLPQGFTVIQSGSAKAYRITADGREQILYIFPTHDYFGARFLFTEEAVPYSVEALEESHVCILSKGQLMHLLAEHPPVALQLIEAMAHRMRRLELIVQSMGRRNAELRNATMLLESSTPSARRLTGLPGDASLSRRDWLTMWHRTRTPQPASSPRWKRKVSSGSSMQGPCSSPTGSSLWSCRYMVSIDHKKTSASHHKERRLMPWECQIRGIRTCW